jgi:hypothetical protein
MFYPFQLITEFQLHMKNNNERCYAPYRDKVRQITYQNLPLVPLYYSKIRELLTYIRTWGFHISHMLNLACYSLCRVIHLIFQFRMTTLYVLVLKRMNKHLL